MSGDARRRTGKKPSRVREGAPSPEKGEGRSRKDPQKPVWRWETTLLAVLFLISFAMLLWIYTCTGVLNVKNVEIRGNERLEAGYLRSLSGITGDTHFLKMNVKAVEKALYSEPYVERVAVCRRFPNTVILDIEEREPGGIIVQGGKYHLVDHQGHILESCAERPPGIVEIRDLEVPLLLPGKEIGGSDFNAVMAFLQGLPPDLKAIADTIAYSGVEGLYLISGGVTVIYGDDSDLERKNTIALLALKSLVDDYGAIEYIDVSVPDYPVLKPLARQ